MKKYVAELIGTFWLVFGGCGSAIYATGNFDVGIGWLGVSFAFGLTVLTMAYTIGHISGCHLNPAVSIGLFVGGRFSAKDLGPYIAAQILGGILAGGALFLILSNKDGFESTGGFASNGFGDSSPEKFGMIAVFLTEFILTAFFLIIIMGATDNRAPAGFAPIAIGLGLTLIHLISIPISNTSVNPARSLGVALFAEGDALKQVWLFWIAPIAGGAVGALIYKFIGSQDKSAA